MVRNYKQTTIKKYSVETLRKCLAEIKAGKISMSKAPKKYGILYGTICNKINNFHPKKHGGQTALSNEFEEVLVKSNIKSDLGMICQEQIGLEVL